MKDYIITYKDWDGFQKNTVVNAYDKADAYRTFKERHPNGTIISCETGQEGCTKYIMIAVGIIVLLFFMLKSC